MSDFTTETRRFVGETATAVGDGYAGFRRNQQYQLQVEYRDDDTVAITLDHHAHVSPGAGPMVVSKAEWERWFQK